MLGISPSFRLFMYHMDSIDADSLAKVFTNLEFVERVKLETVCRLWHYVLQKQSTFSDVKLLNIADFFITTSTEYYQQESISFVPTVVGVVERCGSYVEELTFGQRWLKISQPIVDCIAYYCRKLKRLDFGAVILNADISCILDRIAGQLDDLSLEETSWIDPTCGRRVQNYFLNMKKLRRLNLRSAMFTLNRLHQLPSTLRSLDISGAHPFESVIFTEFLKRQQQLEELYISPVPIIDEDILEAISNLGNLRILHLGYSDRLDLEYNQLQKLTRIEQLQLKNLPGLTENTLRLMLINMPEIHELGIKNCQNIRDYSSLGVCAKMVKLEISDTMQLSDEDYLNLCSYGKLKNLSLVNCFNLTTRGVNIALTRCQLRELIVNRCARVTDEMMYMLASTQRELETISLQGCTNITSKGVSALAWLRNVLLLKDVDVSQNKNVDDTVVISLHNALTMAHRIRIQSLGYEEPCKEQEKKLIMYIFDTSITPRVEGDVCDLIILC